MTKLVNNKTGKNKLPKKKAGRTLSSKVIQGNKKIISDNSCGNFKNNKLFLNQSSRISGEMPGSAKREGGHFFIYRNVFDHGNSIAVNLPKVFADHIVNKRVKMRIDHGSLVIDPAEVLDNIESEPEFESFIQAIAKDALAHPEKLEDLSEINAELWDLVKDVPLEEND